jgi:hypothetical protein
MNNLKNFSPLLVCIFFSSFISPAWSASKHFEWIDDNGTKHMEETCPADCLKKPHLQKDNKGRIIRTDAILTSEEQRTQEKETTQSPNRNLQQFASP